MSGNIIKTENLANGLVLEVHDQSRQIAADRWYVSIMVTVPVPITAATWPDTEPSLESIKALLGEQVNFEKKLDRNFVSATEKDQITTQLLTSFLDTTLTYLAHSDFSRKYILKTYRAEKEKQALKMAQEQQASGV